MKGRKRTPTPILKMRGSRRATTRPNEPPLELGRPEPPAYIASDPVAMDEWNRLIPQLEARRTLCPLDRILVANLCLSVARLSEAQGRIAEFGQCADSSRGRRKLPENSIVEKCLEQIKSYMAELCITPASQSKAAARPDDKQAMPLRRKPA